MENIKQQDLTFGYNKEKYVLPYFNKFFNCNASMSKHKYATFDYIDTQNKIYGELKSRRVKKYKYKDIMIGYNKIRSGLKLINKGFKVYLLWSFVDKLCYYELNKDGFDKSWIKIIFQDLIGEKMNMTH